MQMRLVDEEGKIVPLGKQGEIQIKCCSVFKRYQHMPEKTQLAFTDDGFFKTGLVEQENPIFSMVILHIFIQVYIVW